MRRFVLCAAALVVAAVLVSAQTRGARTLDIYVVDVEGGNATLFVSPSGGSMLMDAGNGGAGAVRDASRIVEAAKAAGLSQIDHMVVTHWHGDHYGALAELAARIPIRHFIDHGPPTQPPAEAVQQFIQTTYPKLHAGAKHTVAKPGDTIPVTGVSVRVVTSNGDLIRASLPGAGRPNSLCGTPPTVKFIPDDHESVGVHVGFGRFSALHLGDLTSNKEYELVCPTNRIGTIDALLGLHHGQDTSNTEAFVHAVRPRMAVMNNGTRKGGWPTVMKTLFSSPGFEDLWQMHFSPLSGQEYTVPGVFIANGIDDQGGAMPIAPQQLPPPGPNAPPAPAHNGPAYWIKVSAQEDGTFTVTNARNGFSKVYPREIQGTR
jgi:beta-lactamase superfamily II metal-dependent hydrolase